MTIEYELFYETFQTMSEQTMEIFFIPILETFIQIVYNLCYDESILETIQTTSEFLILIFFILIIESFIILTYVELGFR